MRLWSAVGNNTKRTQKRIGRSIKWDTKRDRKWYVNDTRSLGGRYEDLKYQGVDLRNAESGHAVYRKTSKLIVT